MNPVVHWELFAKDAPALRTFYADLFGWSLQPLPHIGYPSLTLAPAPASTGASLPCPTGVANRCSS